MVVRRAVLVGISYSGTNYVLKAPTTDVFSMKDFLLRAGYLEENILIVAEGIIEPTKDNIIRSWRWLLSSSSKNDFYSSRYQSASQEPTNLFFYYSGHGVQTADIDGDELDGRDECLVPLDYLTRGLLTDDFLKIMLADQVRSTDQLVIVLDACRSGSGADLKYNYYRAADGNYLTFLTNDKPTIGNVFCFSAALDDQLAYEIQETTSYGVLTRSFINSYRSKILLGSFFQAMVIKINNQTPVLSAGKNLDINSPFLI